MWLCDTDGAAALGRRGNDRFCEGFRTTAHHAVALLAWGPSSESLQRRNPRNVGGNGAVHAMGILMRLVLMRELVTWLTGRLRSGAVATM